MTPLEWFAALCAQMPAPYGPWPQSTPNGNVLNQWAIYEGMYNPAGLSFDRGHNPFMTTWPDSPSTKRSSEDIGFGPGKWNLANSGKGVGMFATPQDGLNATIATFVNDADFAPLATAFRTQTWSPAVGRAWQVWIEGPNGTAHDYDVPLSAYAMAQWGAPVVPAQPGLTLADVIAALGGEAGVRAWNAKGNSLFLGFANVQEQAQETANTVATIKAGMLPPHTHDLGGQTGGVTNR